MPWWKALMASGGLVALAAIFVSVYAVAWLRRRAERSWPAVDGLVAELKIRPGEKGRPNTYLLGSYEDEKGRHRFAVFWDACELTDDGWVPPDGTPPVGSKLRLHADPSNPSRVALDSGPMTDVTAGQVILLAAVLLSCIAGAVMFWVRP